MHIAQVRRYCGNWLAIWQLDGNLAIPKMNLYEFLRTKVSRLAIWQLAGYLAIGWIFGNWLDIWQFSKQVIMNIANSSKKYIYIGLINTEHIL